MSEPKPSPEKRRPRYTVIELDSIPELRSGKSGLYADKLIIFNDRIAVLEEAETLRKRDLDQLATTIKKLREGELRRTLAKYGIQLPQSGLMIGILHRRGGRVDFVVENLRAKYMRELGAGIFIASCNNHLRSILEKLFST